ncbi:hypothetical protein [Pseudomonas sp. 5P_3.1_Bac2]|nr:hypothetical protein [Pseudomonas sp. 5P_3.1_Bac2]MCU1717132.1 hypothetical protein [Pseudomonas sp. 5P_3.1_Bac2]
MKAKPTGQPVCGLKLCSDEMNAFLGVTAYTLDVMGVISQPEI